MRERQKLFLGIVDDMNLYYMNLYELRLYFNRNYKFFNNSKKKMIN